MNIMNLYVYENRSMSNDLSKPLMLENLNVDNVQIHIPKEIDGTDMGTWAWWFVYQNAKREKYSIPMTLEGTTSDDGEEEYISTVGLNHGFTGKHGTVMYAIEAIQADGSGAVTHEWHTKTCKLEIVYTLQGNQTEFDESESDIISALISRVNELIKSGAEIAEIAETIENAAETAQEVIDSIPADYSTLSAQVDTNTEDIGGLKDDLGAYTPIKPSTSVRTFYLAPDSNRIGEHTSAGVTFTVSSDGKSVQAVGTSDSSSASIQVVRGSTSAVPFDFKKGKTYTMKFDTSDNGIYAEVWVKRPNNTISNVSNSGEVTFEIPLDAVGTAFRVLVYNNTTVNGALTNITFEELITPSISPSNTVSDRTDEILARLNAFGYCHLEPGVFYIKNLQMPANSSLCGSGKSTIIRLLDNNDAVYAIATNDNVSIYDLCIEGKNSDITLANDITVTRYGIYHVSDYPSSREPGTKLCNVQINNVFISRFEGAGIYQKNTGTPVETGLVVTCCRIINCNIGIYIERSSEYCKYVGVDITRCYYGFINNGSSNVFDGGSISACYIGFLAHDQGDDTPNAGHLIISNTTLNHFYGSDGTVNQGVCIDITDSWSITFDACNMAFGSINITNGNGIIFSSVQLGNAIPINITNGYLIMFNGCVSRVPNEPVLTITNNTHVVIDNCYARAGTAWNVGA